MRWFVLLLFLFSPVSNASDASRTESDIDRQWLEHGAELEKEGITKPIYRKFYYWMTGQYILGFCAPHMDEREVLNWKSVYRDTLFEKGNFGRTLLLGAAKSYDDGVSARLKNPATSEHCVVVLESWMSDVLNIAEIKD